MNRNDQEFLAQKIRTQYMEKGSTALDELKALDAKVKRPANVFAYVFGSIGAMVMGSGMSLVMTDLGSVLELGGKVALLWGFLIDVVGIVLVSLAYPIYNKIAKKERERVAPEIIRLADELMK